MTAKHRLTRPSPITSRLARASTPVLAGHLTVVVHADGSLSWHVARMDPASRRMTFPYAGLTNAPSPHRPQLIPCLTIGMHGAMDLQLLMES